MFRGLTRFALRYHSVKNMEEFNKLVGGLKTPYVIDFYADWCQPCKMLTPIITKLEEENGGKWALIKVDVDEEAMGELVEQHQIAGVPTLAFYKDNQKNHQVSGAPNKAGLQEL